MASAAKKSASSDVTVVSVEGHRIRLSNLEKVLYPATGTTKGEVLDYYARIAEALIPHAANRPATRKRWVHGVGTAEKPGQVFFQKNLDDSAPNWVKRRTLEHKDHSNDYPLVNDLATLTWLAQIAALEIHVPQWQFGRTGVQKNPDRIVLDLDPGPGVGLAECAEVARLVRDLLGGMGLGPMPVTSGSKGIHLYAALDGKQTSDEVSAVAHELARALESDHPDLVVSDMKKTLRDGRVLVDWSQNNGSKTTITPYSLRGRERPTVAAPRTWAELDSPDLAQLEFGEVLERFAADGDPLAGLTAGHLASLEPTPERMAGFERTGADRLDKYRSMRDAGKTPEPVPEEPAPSGDGRSFVIQEHHARRLHWDFRLEYDGVLVSWALPKGVPTDSAHNHLAVQTEDHPVEYGSFEGRIPAGEYGAGEVTIWDAGNYELEKWRDGEEVIVVLHGERHGTHRYALIHSGGGGKGARAENNWLIHLMKDQGATHEYVKPHAHSAPLADRGAAPAKPPSPMLATLGDEAAIDDESEWAFEMKWDGVRAIAEVRDGAVRLFSRNGVDISAGYPELQAIADTVGADAVLDGEIVALGAGNRPDFGRLQGRMHLRRKSDVERAVRDIPVHFMAFDLLSAAGRSLSGEEYTARRAALEEHVAAGDLVQVPPAFDGDLAGALASSSALGLEGVMAKKLDGRYSPGLRSRTWLKLKHHRHQEVVVVGWRPGHGSRARRVGSLLLGVPDGDGLRYAGRVGTGFTEAALDEMLPRLKKLARKTCPVTEVPSADARDAEWVSPKLVGEVEFAEWTPTGRLRQASWRGWRPDKGVQDISVG
jgi:bifunctional non-homologous end joining protein LigD